MTKRKKLAQRKIEEWCLDHPKIIRLKDKMTYSNYRKLRSELQTASHASKEVRKRISDSVKRQQAEPTAKRKQRKLLESVEWRQAVGAGIHKFHLENREYVLEYRARARKDGAWDKTPEHRKKISRAQRKISNDPVTRKRRSDAQKLLRQDKEWVRRNALAVAAGKAKSKKKGGYYVHNMSSIEVKLGKILKELKLKYRFTGNWKTVVGSHCPDFMHKKFKWIIEIHGTYWHTLSGQAEADKRRLKDFRDHGYKVLVVKDSELKFVDRLTNRIRNFHSTPNSHV